MPKKVLSAALSSAGTRIILPDIEGWDGNDVTAAELGTVHYATLTDFAGTKLEIVEIDPSTLTVATTTGILINKRALSFAGGTTAAAETAYDWTPNETYVLLGSNPPQLYADLMDLNESQTVASGVKTFVVSPIVPTPTTDYQAATKKYADDLTYAGAPDADEATKGVVECATTAEVAAGDDTGSTTAPTVVRPSKLAEVIQKNGYLYAASADLSDTYTVTLTPTPAAYVTGMCLFVKFATANTVAATLNVNSLGAKDIKKYVAGAIAALETGDIVANQICLLAYDGTQFILLNPGATSMTTALASEASTFFAATDITGAEAETLTAGNAITTLHFHGQNNIISSRDMTAASGNVTYAHGLGAVPKWVRCNAMVGGTTYCVANSFGVYNGSSMSSVYHYPTGSNVSNSYFIALVVGAGASQSATVTVDATNITLAWTKTGSPTGGAGLVFEVGV